MGGRAGRVYGRYMRSDMGMGGLGGCKRESKLKRSRRSRRSKCLRQRSFGVTGESNATGGD